jgi:histidine triad (HIT) family protein
MPEKSLFQQIRDGETPGEIVYSDDQVFAIKDKFPDAPLHLLVIPHKLTPILEEITEEDRELMSHMIYVARELAHKHACRGYQLKYNVGHKGGQIIWHLHLHVLGWFDKSA